MAKREVIIMPNTADRPYSPAVRAGDFIFISGAGGRADARGNPVEGIEVCHPNQVTAKMTVDQMKIAADKGAYISFYCTSFRPLQWSWDEFLQATKVVGCDRIIAGTDCGHFAAPTPVESMRVFITGMLTRGIPDKDVGKMIKINPSVLLY